MATVVTASEGSSAKPVGVLYMEPERAVLDAGSDTALSRSGLDAEFLADLLSACLAHERCGVHLYRSVAQRSEEPELVSWYEQFGRETLEHVARLEQLITNSGGSPAYVSPAARATEQAASAMLESTFMLAGSLDRDTAELAMLEAVMLAEAKDRANWEMLTQLAGQVADDDLRQQLALVTEEVLAQEVEHHSWARDTRTAMLIRRAGGEAMSSTGPGEAGESGQNGASKSELYEVAKQLGIEGRSNMTKAQLAQAVADKEAQR
jgi:ferritin-like metal-binding protein YciE